MKFYPRGPDDLQNTLKKLKRFCEKDGVTKELKKHEYYEKPGEKKRRRFLKRIKTISDMQEEARIKLNSIV